MKALLSFFLARSVWQFYSSDWMKNGWTKHAVHFMFEHYPPHSKVIFINEPFLVAQLENGRAEKSKPKGKPKSDISSEMFIAHKYPKILTLGVMLLEIELGHPIEEFKRSDSCDLEGINTIHLATGSVIKDEHMWRPQDAYRLIAEVIEICVKPDTEKLGLNEK